MVNLLVYNFFDESADEIDKFLCKTKSSVYFAVSVADIFRILEKNKISKVFIKFRKLSCKMIDQMVKNNSNTQFYIFTDDEKRSKYPNVFLMPYEKKLNSIKFIKQFKNSATCQ